MITSAGHAQTVSDSSDSVGVSTAVAFANTTLTVNESSKSVDLVIELVKEGNKEINIDVIFLDDESSADTSDISYTTQTISFGKGSTSGDTKKVAVDIISDNIFEGDENIVFQLQNSSTGSIIESPKLNIVITDDMPKIVFNEINASSLDDGAYKKSLKSQKFIEWVNTSKQDVNIGGWAFARDNKNRFTFPAGSVIGAGKAVILFESDESLQPVDNYGGSDIYKTSDIGLSGSSQQLTLKDQNGTVVVSAKIDNITAGESKNLRSEGSGIKYVNHSTLSGGALLSPGTRVDGTTFGNGTYAAGIRGNEGWRLISTPTQNTNFNDLFANLWTQGATGSDASSETANIYNWQERSGGVFTPVTDMSADLSSGKGYIVYMYEDDDFRTPGVQGGFPKVVNTSEAENSSPVSVPVTSNDDGGASGIDGSEGYNLLGNPYGTDISVAEVMDALEAVHSNVNANVYVWDANAGSGNGAFATLSAGDRLAPFQAFFIRYKAERISDNVSFDRRKLTANLGTDFYKQPTSSKSEFEIVLSNADKFDTYKVKFSEEGTAGEDRYDAYKLFSLNPNSIGLYSTVGNNVKLAKNVLPDLESLEGELRIPLGLKLPKSGNYTFSWNELDEIADDLTLYLVDKKTNRKVNLRTSEQLSFSSIISEEKEDAVKEQLSSDITGKNVDTSSRFELLVVAAANNADNNSEPQKIVEVSPNYPNPFRSQTTMDLKLQEKMHVKMTIWNIVGQKIATVCDEMMEAGEHPMTWNITANMPSGIYICKVEAGGKVLTRKMTLVK